MHLPSLLLGLLGLGLTASASPIEVRSDRSKAGTYKEQLTISYKGKLTMYGETTDTSSYKQNRVTITHTISSPQAGTLDKSATVNVRSDGFKMYNINVINAYGKGSQAVAYVDSPRTLCRR
jgi:pectinesterase